MNIITSILSLQDFRAAPHAMDDQGRAFAQGYGNRVASRQAFPPLGHESAHEPRDAFANELCATGACG